MGSMREGTMDSTPVSNSLRPPLPTDALPLAYPFLTDGA